MTPWNGAASSWPTDVVPPFHSSSSSCGMEVCLISILQIQTFTMSLCTSSLNIKQHSLEPHCNENTFFTVMNFQPRGLVGHSSMVNHFFFGEEDNADVPHSGGYSSLHGSLQCKDLVPKPGVKISSQHATDSVTT